MDAVIVRGGLVELLRVGDRRHPRRHQARNGRLAHDAMSVIRVSPLAELLDAFASNAAVPGGGSAAALAGAVGASLLIMVAGLPKTRHGTDEERAALAAAAARLKPLRDELAALIDRDSEAYTSVHQRLSASEVERRGEGRAPQARSTPRCAPPPRRRWRRCARASGRCAKPTAIATSGAAAAASDVAVAHRAAEDGRARSRR